MRVTSADVLRRRVHVQQLDRAGPATDADVLDLGVQDTGADGAAWALAQRGVAAGAVETVLAWTLRGAPHAYRRNDAAAVAMATAPRSEADAAKRVLDASVPLKSAGIPVLEALDSIAEQMRDVVREPTVKGAMSGALAERMGDPYLRWCRPCGVIHLYEMPFRIAALRAGLELRPGTSPPVLERIPGWRGPATEWPPRLDPVRAVLHHLGPLTPRQVAGYLDAPLKEVKAVWPDDTVPVTVDGEERFLLAEDLPGLEGPPEPTDGAGGEPLVRLLGPFDPFLQARDRELVVPDPARRKDLWRTLGRPGAVLVGSQVRGTWRPRAAGSRLRLLVDAWEPLPDLGEQAERLADFRGARLTGIDRAA